MPQSLSSILIHLVFSTKNREPFITPAIETELHPYLATIFRALKSPPKEIEIEDVPSRHDIILPFFTE